MLREVYLMSLILLFCGCQLKNSNNSLNDSETTSIKTDNKTVKAAKILEQKQKKTQKAAFEAEELAKRTMLKAKEALDFCAKKKYSQDYCILIDMKIHSGKNRFFIWDFNKNEIWKEALVSHGCCDSPWGEDASKTNPIFSNTEGSHCSSLGKYKIGERGVSQWGINIKYLMHGLEASNNQALKRTIVLHSWEAVSDKETYPNGTPEGWGCPALSNNCMTKLDSLLQKQTRPTLLWIYQ